MINEKLIKELEGNIQRIQYHLNHPLTSTDNVGEMILHVEKLRKEIARLKGN